MPRTRPLEFGPPPQKSTGKEATNFVQTKPSATCTVIILSHNYGHWLGEAIESVLTQTYRVSEILVVDDSSTDNTREVTERFGVRYQRVELRSPHLSRSAGFWATNGEFVCFLDADDRLAPDFIEKCLTCLQSTDSDVAFTNQQEFGERTFLWTPNYCNIHHGNNCHVSCLARRSLLQASLAYATPNEFPAEDWEVWKRVERAGGRFIKAESVHYYRIHNSSRSKIRVKYNELRTCVTGVYLTNQNDPQRPNVYWPKDDVALVEKWVNTALAVRVSPILIVDHDVPKIQKTWPHLRIFKCKPCPKEHNLAAWKWFAVHEFLNDQGSVLDAFFVTDISDVEFRINPFMLITHGHELWVGKERDHINRKTPSGNWVCNHAESMFGSVHPELIDKPILNAGIVGGWRYGMDRFVASMLDHLAKSMGAKLLTDMIPLNLIAYTEWDSKRLWAHGEPLHSHFRMFQNHRTDVCIIHK